MYFVFVFLGQTSNRYRAMANVLPHSACRIKSTASVSISYSLSGLIDDGFYMRLLRAPVPLRDRNGLRRARARMSFILDPVARAESSSAPFPHGPFQNPLIALRAEWQHAIGVVGHDSFYLLILVAAMNDFVQFQNFGQLQALPTLQKWRER